MCKSIPASLRCYRNANRKSRAVGHATWTGSSRTRTRIECTYCRAELLSGYTDRLPSHVVATIYTDGHTCATRAGYEVVANRGLRLPVARMLASVAASGVGAVAAVGALIALVC